MPKNQFVPTAPPIPERALVVLNSLAILAVSFARNDLPEVTAGTAKLMFIMPRLAPAELSAVMAGMHRATSAPVPEAPSPKTGAKAKRRK